MTANPPSPSPNQTEASLSALEDAKKSMPGIGKDIVRKMPTESLTQFYARAEKRGVARQCTNCGFRRRFSMVTCPICTQTSFHQTASNPHTSPVKGIPSTPSDPNSQPETQTSGDGNFAFSPNSEFDPKSDDKGAGDKGSTPKKIVAPSKPFVDQTISELKSFAESNNIDVGDWKKKSELIELLEAKLGGLE